MDKMIVLLLLATTTAHSNNIIILIWLSVCFKGVKQNETLQTGDTGYCLIQLALIVKKVTELVGMGLLIAFADVLMLCTHNPYDNVKDIAISVEYKDSCAKENENH